ncbi:flagellar biosynthesis protein FlhF [Variovorax sp. TBS-050B]|uniref:flagellar biosynthesis protein FlhF n=1 Tax=Variovorax sp. TBS-050B TaxID=2940551 RepID=UPI0024731A8E|nr:flagellar biosynthesis protein FlhF [Variovorax sp. TBS-050B]MDH6591074.1 flagellar biosynthesis protein FlhF [Variovorax sp. TBS-050B]
MNTHTDVRTSARKFVAPTSREALRMAREALGDEAIVLTNRVIAEGVEIVAMVQQDVEEVHAKAPIAPPPPVQPPAPAAPVLTLTPPPAPAPVAPAPATLAADSVLGELHSMRCMIEEQLAGVAWNDKQRRDPMRGRLLRTLLGAGFSARLSKAMLEHLPTGQSYAQGMAFVRSELIRTLPVHDDEDALLAQGGVYALMGPTGVGKTTTTAKLAARCVMRFGADKLALVTTDSYRIGAYEQLRIYGQILNVPVYAVKDAADLHLVLQDLREKHMVLIDTVGMSQRDRAVSDQIAMLCSSHRPVKRLLLLNATSHGDTLNEVVHAYRHGSDSELAGCIFTKVDEATHPGALIDTVIRHRLPVHYVSSGQKVPENLMRADRAQLVDSAFQANSRSALFVPGEGDLHDAAAAANAAATSAQAEAERQRLQYRRLIEAMAHDAQEVAATASALAAAPLGFEQARALWRQAGDDEIGHKAVLQTLMTHAAHEVATGCDTHLLALGGQVGLKSEDGSDAYHCQGSLLLSDRTGQPLAAPNQWLSTAATRNAADPMRKPGVRQVQWLRQQDFGRPVVHMLPRLPSGELMLQWQVQHQQWLARVPGSTAVTDPRTGEYATLNGLDFAYGEARALRFKGRVALQMEAQASVTLRTDGGLPGLRCIATRVVDPRSRKVLAQGYALSNIGTDAVPLHRLAQWQAWAAEAEPCFRLLRQGLAVLGGLGEAGDPHMMKRLLIAGQITTTVWRLLQADADWAVRARTLLAQLTGRQVRAGRPVTGNVLYAGVGKLFLLLEALDT